MVSIRAVLLRLALTVKSHDKGAFMNHSEDLKHFEQFFLEVDLEASCDGIGKQRIQAKLDQVNQELADIKNGERVA